MKTRRCFSWLWIIAAITLWMCPADSAFAAEGKSPAATVKLIVDYGDGVQKHFTAIAWTDGMTVLDAMEIASRHRRGITWDRRGRGATAFLTRIDDVQNEGNGRNWIFHVNGKLADCGLGVHPLASGDTILWTFAEYR